MNEYIISVGKIEELQMIGDLTELTLIFERARKVVVSGGSVVLVRVRKSGESDKFDEFTNLDDFDAYKKSVFKYL